MSTIAAIILVAVSALVGVALMVFPALNRRDPVVKSLGFLMTVIPLFVLAA